MKHAPGTSLFLFICIFLFGCSGENGENENTSIRNLSDQEMMRYRQYVVYGQQLYLQNCSNCHQENGTGLGRVIPPLAQSDYMLNDLGRTVCLIKNGLEDTITVNGEEYHQKMPANEKLTALEIAQITTYIVNSWGNEGGFISVKHTTDFLEQCNE